MIWIFLSFINTCKQARSVIYGIYCQNNRLDYPACTTRESKKNCNRSIALLCTVDVVSTTQLLRGPEPSIKALWVSALFTARLASFLMSSMAVTIIGRVNLQLIGRQTASRAKRAQGTPETSSLSHGWLHTGHQIAMNMHNLAGRTLSGLATHGRLSGHHLAFPFTV